MLDVSNHDYLRVGKGRAAVHSWPHGEAEYLTWVWHLTWVWLGAMHEWACGLHVQVRLPSGLHESVLCQIDFKLHHFMCFRSATKGASKDKVRWILRQSKDKFVKEPFDDVHRNIGTHASAN